MFNFSLFESFSKFGVDIAERAVDESRERLRKYRLLLPEVYKRGSDEEYLDYVQGMKQLRGILRYHTSVWVALRLWWIVGTPYQPVYKEESYVDLQHHA